MGGLLQQHSLQLKKNGKKTGRKALKKRAKSCSLSYAAIFIILGLFCSAWILLPSVIENASGFCYRALGLLVKVAFSSNSSNENDNKYENKLTTTSLRTVALHAIVTEKPFIGKISTHNNSNTFAGNVGELLFLTIPIVQDALANHPFKTEEFQKSLNFKSNSNLVHYMKFLFDRPTCRRRIDGKQLPVFVSMANVYSDLYWQL